MENRTSYVQNDRQRQDAVDFIIKHNEDFFIREHRQPVAFTHSYGCQQNVADNEVVNGILLELGYTFTDDPELADIVIYNTCAIRENAEDRVFGNIGQLKQAKQKNPDMIIGVFGCMMQQKHILEKLKKSYPYVDLVFGAGVMHELPELLHKKLLNGSNVISVGSPTVAIVEDLPVKRQDNFRASIPIIAGCNNFCTYCIVPYVRGRERSRLSEDIVKDAEKLIEQGYKEITLLGQNVNSYGKDLENEISFPQLLEQIAGIPGKFRLRFMTSHPKDCTEELIDTVLGNDKICNHIHLPVQSGSNRVLSSMNRGYTSEQYLNLVEYAKSKSDGFSFTSDIIVGFPGETEDDFKQTMSLADKVGYNSLYTFIYSPRPGTKATQIDDPVPQETKVKWLTELINLQRKKANTINEQMVGKIFEVLVDGESQKYKGYLTGRTDSNTIVIFNSSDTKLIGEFADIKIEKYMNWAVEGQLINKKENFNG